MSLKLLIKQTFENTVLCARSHSPKEAYDYAERMERIVKERIKDRLQVILNNPTFTEVELKRLIQELGDDKKETGN